MNRAKHLQSAKRRALTILLGFLAGLRNNELANLRWSMIGDEVIELPAEITKSGRLEFVPLHDGLRDVLRAVRRDRGVEEGRTVADSDLVVGYLDKGEHPTLPVHIAERIREDAEWIKLPTTDEAGRVLETHAHRLFAALTGAREAIAELAGGAAGPLVIGASTTPGIYLLPDRCGQGLGAPLYGRLVDMLRAQGFHSVVGGITLPNDVSVRLHEKLGFRHWGTSPHAGWKFGAWHDVGFWQLMLQPAGHEPGPLLPPARAFAATA